MNHSAHAISKGLCVVPGLALGGTVRFSQVQRVPPLLSMLFAVPVLGERLDAVTVGLGRAVIATVLAGKKMPAVYWRCDSMTKIAASSQTNPLPTPSARAVLPFRQSIH